MLVSCPLLPLFVTVWMCSHHHQTKQQTRGSCSLPFHHQYHLFVNLFWSTQDKLGRDTRTFQQDRAPKASWLEFFENLSWVTSHYFCFTAVPSQPGHYGSNLSLSLLLLLSGLLILWSCSSPSMSALPKVERAAWVAAQQQGSNEHRDAAAGVFVTVY